MEKKELIEKVIARLSGDPELLKKVSELTLDTEDIELASDQKPATMYVLTEKVTVMSDLDKPLHHYHPIVESCFLYPNATENKMMCSSSLIEMQRLQKNYAVISKTDIIILAVSIEVFEKLQMLLDETIAELMGSIRHATEAIIKENEKRVPAGAIDFYDMYRTVLSQMIRRTNKVIGSALTEESEIVETIGDVEYKAEYENAIKSYTSDDESGECDHKCEHCYRDYCCEEDECGECDKALNCKCSHSIFFGTIRRD